MSEEQLTALLTKIKEDAGLQEKLKTATSPDAAIEIVKEAGFSITAEDIHSMQSSTVELSGEELEVSAGGLEGILLPSYTCMVTAEGWGCHNGISY